MIAFPVEPVELVQLFPETKLTGILSCGKAKLSNCTCPRDHFPVPVSANGQVEIHLKRYDYILIIYAIMIGEEFLPKRYNLSVFDELLEVNR